MPNDPKGVAVDADEVSYLCAALGNMFAGDTLDREEAEWLDRARTAMRALLAENAALQQRCEGLEADNERLKGAFDDADEQASVHWYGEWVEYKRRAEAAEAERDALQARLAACEADARRYRWLRVRWGRVGEQYDGATSRMVAIGDDPEGWEVDPESLDAAIDSAISAGGE